MTTYVVSNAWSTNITAQDRYGNYRGARPEVGNKLASSILSHRFSKLPGAGQWDSLRRGYGFNTNPLGPIPQPDTRSSTKVVELERHPNKGFKKRSAHGEVVVAPYVVDSLTVIERQFLTGNRNTFYVGLNEKDSRGYCLDNLGYPRTTFPYSGGLYLSDQGQTEWYNGVVWIEYIENPSFSWSTGSYDWETLTRPPSFEFSETQMASAVANAYDGSVDALTTLAEMPETVHYIIDVLRSVVRIKRDFLNKESRLRKNAELRRKRLQQLLADITAYMAGNISKRQRRNAIRNAKRTARDLNRVSLDLTSNLASLWLQYRYAIMPNVYLVRDLAESAKRFGWTKISERNREVKDLPLLQVSGLATSGKRTNELKATARVSLGTTSTYDRLLAVANVNVFATAWELVPLSFVVDWFVNVGDAIAVMSPPSSMISEGLTFSNRYTLEQTFTSPSLDVTVKRNRYVRQVYHTEDFSGVHVNVDLNWRRVLDAAALVWSIGGLRTKLRF